MLNQDYTMSLCELEKYTHSNFGREPTDINHDSLTHGIITVEPKILPQKVANLSLAVEMSSFCVFVTFCLPPPNELSLGTRIYLVQKSHPVYVYTCVMFCHPPLQEWSLKL